MKGLGTCGSVVQWVRLVTSHCKWPTVDVAWKVSHSWLYTWCNSCWSPEEQEEVVEGAHRRERRERQTAAAAAGKEAGTLIVQNLNLLYMSFTLQLLCSDHREGGNKRCFCLSICPSVCPMWELHLRCRTFIPNLGTLGLWVLELFAMYVADGLSARPPYTYRIIWELKGLVCANLEWRFRTLDATLTLVSR